MELAVDPIKDLRVDSMTLHAGSAWRDPASGLWDGQCGEPVSERVPITGDYRTVSATCTFEPGTDSRLVFAVLWRGAVAIMHMPSLWIVRGSYYDVMFNAAGSPSRPL